MGAKMKTSEERPQSYLTTREACDTAGYSRPDSFLRAWRAAGLPVYRVPSGRKVVAMADLESFVQPEPKSTNIPAALYSGGGKQ